MGPSNSAGIEQCNSSHSRFGSSTNPFRLSRSSTMSSGIRSCRLDLPSLNAAFAAAYISLTKQTSCAGKRNRAYIFCLNIWLACTAHDEESVSITQGEASATRRNVDGCVENGIIAHYQGEVQAELLSF
mmetsp:Transcript_44792/g.74321  ORF Transcript_44792/g.74321 Transcript_44792/m.74321 type:complete len:129 (-) Transcript_44792:70-456(-)